MRAAQLLHRRLDERTLQERGVHEARVGRVEDGPVLPELRPVSGRQTMSVSCYNNIGLGPEWRGTHLHILGQLELVHTMRIRIARNITFYVHRSLEFQKLGRSASVASHDRVPSEKTTTKEWIVKTGNCQ